MITTKLAIHFGDRQPDPRDKYISATSKRITAELLTRPDYQGFLTPDAAPRAERDFNELIPLVSLMHAKAVKLLAGTDCAASIIYPGFCVHDELELMVTAGLTPMEALLTATANPAQVLGQKDLGVIRSGSFADFVLLHANPLDDIRNTKKIHAVVSRGKVYSRPDLDTLRTAFFIHVSEK